VLLECPTDALTDVEEATWFRFLHRWIKAHPSQVIIINDSKDSVAKYADAVFNIN